MSTLPLQRKGSLLALSVMQNVMKSEHVGTPAPPEAIQMAKELVTKYPSCFWFWKDTPEILYTEDIQLVIQRLREYGDKRTWEAARELSACL